MEGWLGFVLASLALAGSPGPATLGLAAAGAAFGARRGLGYLGGIVIGMIGVMAIVATGVAGILLAAPGATPLFATLAAVYFLYLAFRIATAPPLSDQATGRKRPSFIGGLFLSLINPKGYAAMAALFSGFELINEDLVLDAAAKGLCLTAIIAAVNVVWLFSGAALTRFFRNPRANRAINLAFAILLLASLPLALSL